MADPHEAPHPRREVEGRRAASGQARGDSNTSPDLIEAGRFLALLDEEAAGFTFQTFDDSKSSKSPHLARVLHGTLDEHAETLAKLNAAGAGVFVTVNATNGRGRAACDIQQVRALFVDLDGAPLEPVRAAPLAPQLVVESSPGRWHSYWKVDGAPLEKFGAVQKALAAKYGSDPSIHDLPRVMRLPGFWHLKGEPYRTRLLEAGPGLSIPFADFCAAFGIDTEAPPRVAGGLDTLLRDRPQLTEGVAEGSRNAAAARLAGRLIGEGKSPEEVLVFLRGWNLKNRPLLDDAELMGVVASIAKADERNHPEGHDDRATIARLAALSPLEYDRIREAEAERLKVRLGTLDAEVKAARPAEEKTGAMVFPEGTPWPEPVDGAKLFSEIAATVRRFVVCEKEAAIAATLWAAMTWFMDVVHVAPLLALQSPEKRCGKTVLLTLLSRLTHRPIAASNISSPALFRAIEAWAPTLLIDEADSFLRDDEALRGVIDSGHAREAAFVVRCEGEDFAPRRFSTWGAKAIAGIGDLAGTIEDRAVVLPLRRKLPSERVERLRYAKAGLFDELQSRLARWAEDHREAIRHARPELPEELHDRAQDNFEAILAIADAAGGDWPELAREAALKLSGKEEAAASVGVELLKDIRAVFDGTDRLGTTELIERLVSDPERRWASYHRSSPITPRQLAKRLGPFGIKSKKIRFAEGALQGFTREQFQEAFTRYVPLLSGTPAPNTPSSPATPILSGTSGTLNETNDLLDLLSGTEGGGVPDRKSPNTLTDKVCSGVPDRIPPSGAKGGIGSGTEAPPPLDDGYLAAVLADPEADAVEKDNDPCAEAAQPWRGAL